LSLLNTFKVDAISLPEHCCHLLIPASLVALFQIPLIRNLPIPYLIIAFSISKPIPAIASDVIDTCTAVADLIDTLTDLPTSTPSLYVDVEGVHLSRHGSISILQLLVSPDKRTYLIDVYTLGDKAFSTAGATGQTLKGILESDLG
jgi:hypothetical protein